MTSDPAPEQCHATKVLQRYSFKTLSSSDEGGDGVRCTLPITHNADGSWHEAAWTSSRAAVSVRWADDEGDATCPWPHPLFAYPWVLAAYINRALEGIERRERLRGSRPRGTPTRYGWRSKTRTFQAAITRSAGATGSADDGSSAPLGNGGSSPPASTEPLASGK
jgi:hypothetical protein